MKFILQKSVSWKDRRHLLHSIKCALLTGEIIKNIELGRTRKEVVMLLRVIIQEVTRIRYRKDNRKLRSVI